MKRNLVAGIVGAAMLASVLAGCSTSSSQGGASEKASDAALSVSTDASASDTKASDAPDAANAEDGRTKLTVGFDAEFPPYGYRNDQGEYTGFDLELAQAVCDMEGWELVKQPIDWEAKDAELSSGAIDCIWNGFTVTGRENLYTWTVPYVDNSIVYVVATDSGITKADDLQGKIVAVQKDSSALAALNEEENQALKESFGSLTEYADYNTAFMDLEAGSVECVALDIGVAKYQVSSRGDGFVILDDKLSTEQYAVGFMLGNESLRDAVQADLIKLYQDGTVEKLAENYADYGLKDSLCLGEYIQ